MVEFGHLFPAKRLAPNTVGSKPIQKLIESIKNCLVMNMNGILQKHNPFMFFIFLVVIFLENHSLKVELLKSLKKIDLQDKHILIVGLLLLIFI